MGKQGETIVVRKKTPLNTGVLDVYLMGDGYSDIVAKNVKSRFLKPALIQLIIKRNDI
tara:strand:- start:269 stop:442 length:174 start_codon:yes stop_codon:yes gene_type:complete